MPDKDTGLVLRNLRKHPHFDTERSEGGKHIVKYKGEVVGTIAETPGDRNSLLVAVNVISRNTGLDIDRKGRVKGRRLQVVHGRGAGTPPVLVLPPEMASELDGEDVITGKPRKVDLTPPSGPVRSDGRRPCPECEASAPLRCYAHRHLDKGAGRPKLEFERPAAVEKPVAAVPPPAPAPPKPEPQVVPEPEPVAAAETPSEEQPPVPAAAAPARPARRGRGPDKRKRPSLSAEALKARRDLVVDYLYERHGETFNYKEIAAFLTEMGDPLTESGAYRFCEQLVESGRIKRTFQGRTRLYYATLDDRPPLPHQERVEEPEETTVEPEPTPEPEPQSTWQDDVDKAGVIEPQEPTTAAQEPVETPPAPVQVPEPEPTPVPVPEAPAPAAATIEESPAYQIYLRGREVKNMSNGVTAADPNLIEQIRKLEKENLALRMLAKMKGLSDEDIQMALDMARMV